MDKKELNSFSKKIIRIIEEAKKPDSENSSNINPLVSELTSWYEKFRNSIEYRDEEVILRASIERMLKRRLALGGNGASTAKPLLKELVWARYFPESIYTKDIITKIEDKIDFYLKLKNSLIKNEGLKEGKIRDLIFQLMSSDIEEFLNPNKVEETISNYIFFVLQKNISVDEENEEARDIQLYIAIRKAYSKDDAAFLRYKLFLQYFGSISDKNVDEISQKFRDAHNTIENQLTHPSRFKILGYTKKQIAPFLILENLLALHDVGKLAKNTEELDNTLHEIINQKYKSISEKVTRAIVRSVIFILLSKTFIALFVEGTYERIVYGEIKWLTLVLNVLIPTLFMITVGLAIRTPGEKNTKLIIGRIHSLLFDKEPKVGRDIAFPQKDNSEKSSKDWIFLFLWFVAFILSFGAISFVLSVLGFSFVSKLIFIFFLAIVSFLAYRISITAREYNVESSQGILTPVVDFFFMPVARVGQYLSVGVSQINIFLFILDFIIETPYKGLVAFFDQWFYFLHSKREEME